MKIYHNDGDSALRLGKIKVRWSVDRSKIEVK